MLAMANQKKDNRAKDQIQGFKDAARESGCDASEASFERALGKIGRAKAAVPPATKKRKRP
jgi:hypothetical protein